MVDVMAPKVVYETTEGFLRVAVLMMHQADTGLTEALKAAETLSESGHLSSIVVVKCGSSPQDDYPSQDGSSPQHSYPSQHEAAERASDIDVHVLHEGKWERGWLFDVIHSTGAVRNVDILCAGSAALNDSCHTELLATMDMVLAEMWKVAPSKTRVSSHCVWFPDYSNMDISPPQVWLKHHSDSNLVVIPEDREHERSMAMPMFSNKHKLHGWHIMTELAAIAGLYSTMQGTPLEFIRHVATGIDEASVQLVRSMCKMVHIKLPSFDFTDSSAGDTASGDPYAGDTDRGNLPVPSRCVAVADPYNMIKRVNKSLYPEEFRLPCPDIEQTLEDSANYKHNKHNMLSSTKRLATYWQLFKYYFTGVHPISQSRDHSQACVKRMGEAYPWFEEIAQNGDTENMNNAEAPVDADKALDILYDYNSTIKQVDVPSAGWEHILESTLGMIDGVRAAENIRSLTGDARNVIVNRSALTSQSENIQHTICALDNTRGFDNSSYDTRYTDYNTEHDAYEMAGALPSQTVFQTSQAVSTNKTSKKFDMKSAKKRYYAALQEEAKQAHLKNIERSETSPYAALQELLAETDPKLLTGMKSYPYLQDTQSEDVQSNLDGLDEEMMKLRDNLDDIERYLDKPTDGDGHSANSIDISDRSDITDFYHRALESGSALDDIDTSDSNSIIGSNDIGDITGSGGRGTTDIGDMLSAAQGAQGGYSPTQYTLNKGLLAQVTDVFNYEIAEAKLSAATHINALVERLDQMRQPVIKASSYIKNAFLASIICFIFLLVTRTPVSETLTIESFEPSQRTGFFLCFSLSALFLAALRQFSEVTRSTQNSLLTLSVGYFVAMLTLILLTPDGLDSLDFGSIPWLYTTIIFTTVATLAWAKDQPPTNKQVKSLMGPASILTAKHIPSIVLIVYIFVIGAAIVNLSPIQGILDSDTLDVVLFSSTAMLFVISFLMMRRVHVLHIKELRISENQSYALLEQSEKAAEYHNLLEKLKLHWLGTAVVLNRLINHPFGSSHNLLSPDSRPDAPLDTSSPLDAQSPLDTHDTHASLDAQSPPLTQSPPLEALFPLDAVSPIKKMNVFTVELASKRDALFDRVLADMTPPGWLLSKYRMLSEFYVANEQSHKNVNDITKPEWCAYPVTWESVERGTSGGSRWRFAYQVYNGEYDEMLKRSTDETLSELILQALHDIDVQTTLTDHTDQPRALTDVLADLIPQGESRMPSGALPHQLNDPPEYEPMVWWPNSIDITNSINISRANSVNARDASHAVSSRYETNRHGAITPEASYFKPKGKCDHVLIEGDIILQAVRVDISSPLLASQLQTQVNQMQTPLDAFANADNQTLNADNQTETWMKSEYADEYADLM